MDPSMMGRLFGRQPRQQNTQMGGRFGNLPQAQGPMLPGVFQDASYALPNGNAQQVPGQIPMPQANYGGYGGSFNHPLTVPGTRPPAFGNQGGGNQNRMPGAFNNSGNAAPLGMGGGGQTPAIPAMPWAFPQLINRPYTRTS